MTEAQLQAAKQLADQSWHTGNEVGTTIRALLDEVIELRTKLAKHEPEPTAVMATDAKAALVEETTHGLEHLDDQDQHA